MANKIATSQIALPEDACTQVYATSGYEGSATTFANSPLASDVVFGDDAGERQIGSATGSLDAGLTVDLAVPVRAA